MCIILWMNSLLYSYGVSVRLYSYGASVCYILMEQKSIYMLMCFIFFRSICLLYSNGTLVYVYSYGGTVRLYSNGASVCYILMERQCFIF